MYNRLQILSHSKNCCLGTLFLPPSGPVSQISGNSPLSCPGLSQIALGGHRSCSPSSSAHTQHGMQEKYLWNRRFQCVQVHSHGPIHHLALNPSVAQLSSKTHMLASHHPLMNPRPLGCLRAWHREPSVCQGGAGKAPGSSPTLAASSSEAARPVATRKK